jgi:hypothetical protein
MAEETKTPALPTARVAARPGASGVSEKRRRIYQGHLLLFLVVATGLVALDLYTSPAVQWAHFLIVPWLLVFLLHSAGLKSRGYSVAEMLIPPRRKPVKEVYTTPLDYELIRARQLRDGVANAAAAVRNSKSQLADEAEAAADRLVSTVENVVATARSQKYHRDERAEKMVPETQAALDVLDQLHRGLLKLEVLSEPEEELPLEAVEDQTEALRKLV